MLKPNVFVTNVINVKNVINLEAHFFREYFGGKSPMKQQRIGLGYDIHPFERGKQLTLGGVKIPFHMGLEGHSDGDCLSHSIIDALLGAAAAGDIGNMFGVDRPEYKNAVSLALLEKAWDTLKKTYRIANIDTVIICQEPKLGGYVQMMKKNIAAALGIKESSVSVKSTTAKKLGEIGRVKAISSRAIVLLTKK